MKKRARKRKRLKRMLLLFGGAAAFAALLALFIVLIVRLSCHKPEPTNAVATAAPSPYETALPTETPTPVPTATAKPPITDDWYAARTDLLEQYVRAFSGLSDESEIRARVAGMAIDPAQKRVAFTFDDGPQDDLTDAVLDICEQYNARVTFFIMGRHIVGHEPQLKRMLALGCEIGNHTWDHADVETLTAEQMRQQIEDVNRTLFNVLGYRCHLFRPPYIRYGDKGSETRNTLIGILRDNEMAIVNHTRSSHDTYSTYSADRIYERCVAETDELGHGLHNSIILCHDKTEKTVEAFRRIVPTLQERGYQFVTVSELLYCSEDGFHVGWIYSKAD